MKSPKMLFFRMIVGFLMFPLVSQYLGSGIVNIR
jgi:hypothetical protein